MKTLIALIALSGLSLPIPAQATEPSAVASLEEGGAAGEKAPLFVAVDPQRVEISLEKILSKGPAIVLFYRGHW